MEKNKIVIYQTNLTSICIAIQELEQFIQIRLDEEKQKIIKEQIRELNQQL